MCKIYIYHKIGGNIAICKKMNKAGGHYAK